jgi:hypothetical protein
MFTLDGSVNSDVMSVCHPEKISGRLSVPGSGSFCGNSGASSPNRDRAADGGGNASSFYSTLVIRWCISSPSALELTRAHVRWWITLPNYQTVGMISGQAEEPSQRGRVAPPPHSRFGCRWCPAGGWFIFQLQRLASLLQPMEFPLCAHCTLTRLFGIIARSRISDGHVAGRWVASYHRAEDGGGDKT